MGQFSLTHLLLFAIIILVFFGPSRLPQLGQSLGKAIRGFKEGLNELEAEAKPVDEQKTQLKNNESATKTASQTQSEKDKTQT